jgi:hypothetical protein
MEAIEIIAPDVGVKPACEAFGISRAGLYRRRSISNRAARVPQRRPAPPRTLSTEERKEVLDILHSDRFQDKAPHEVYATLLDEVEQMGSGLPFCYFSSSCLNSLIRELTSSFSKKTETYLFLILTSVTPAQTEKPPSAPG